MRKVTQVGTLWHTSRIFRNMIPLIHQLRLYGTQRNETSARLPASHLTYLNILGFNRMDKQRSTNT